METRKKIIPRFETPEIQSKVIKGCKVTLRRLRATESPEVLSHVLGDFGFAVASWLSAPDAPTMEKMMEGIDIDEDMSAEQLKELGLSKFKMIITSEAFAQITAKLKTGEVVDMKWYVERMIPGNLWLEDVHIETMEELDESGVTASIMAELFWYAIEVNFHPTFGAAGTDSGSDEELPESPEASPIRGSSSGRAESGRDGQRVQTRAAAG